MFVLNSDVTIGNFRFSGVNEVVIKRSIHSIVETATIKIPSIATIITKGKKVRERITTADQFKEGDKVTIKLGYNGDLKTEFQGFVNKRKMGLPFEIECEGASWLLRKNKPEMKVQPKTIKDLIATAVSNVTGGHKIDIECDVDIDLSNISLNSPTGFEIVNYISKCTDNNVICFFIGHNKLWCGLLYSNLASGKKLPDTETVTYKVRYNTLPLDRLVPHSTEGKTGSVEYSRRLTNGSKITHVSTGVSENEGRHVMLLNHIKDVTGLKLLADEWVCKNGYKGYEGSLTGFLQPYARPGHCAVVNNAHTPGLNGTYFIESTEVTFGTEGARRKVELGPKVGEKNQ